MPLRTLAVVAIAGLHAAQAFLPPHLPVAKVSHSA
jgi:hypothetical protein